ncbi:lanC-like protein GCL2 isoform X2 [Wolffia australiana]
MADRYFCNDMPEFVAEEGEEEELVARSSLLKLLHEPFPSAADRFLRAGIDLKEKIVEKTWIEPGRRVRGDFSLYTGTLGTAFLLLKAYQITNNEADLRLCSEIVRACDSASQSSRCVTFICGRAGVCAIGAVAAKYAGDDPAMNHFLSSFRSITLPPDVPNELLYGRAGYIWACSFLNKHIGPNTIPPSHTAAMAKKIVEEGREQARRSGSEWPLMYEWHGKKYLGAAHGVAGIMNALMTVDLSGDDRDLVKSTILSLIRRRLPGGNYPSSEGGHQADRLVHWCHGAPGAAMTLVRAHQVFGGEFLAAAGGAAEVVWRRGLLKRVGLCHGVSGNAHVFLSLHRATGGGGALHRAKAFASFLLDRGAGLIAAGEMDGGDRPLSLFEGQGGVALLFLSMASPLDSSFPGYEL